MHTPDWRSLLFCPVIAERFVAKAHCRGADAIILDLEDSIPPAEKQRARVAVAQAVDLIAQHRTTDIVIRINRPLDLAVSDIAVCVRPGVSALMVPKAMGPEHIRLLSEVVAGREIEQRLPVGSIGLIPMVETAEALSALEAIGRSDPRVVAMGVGSEDLATELGALPSVDSMYLPKMMGIIAARASGILPLGLLGSVSMKLGADEYRARARRSRDLGMACAACIHPDQVTIINEEFGPRPEETARAHRIVTAFEAAERQGQGAVMIEGEMIDLPVVIRARRLLALAARAEATKIMETKHA